MKDLRLLPLLYLLLTCSVSQAQTPEQPEKIKYSWNKLITEFRRNDDLWLNYVVSVKAAGLPEKNWSSFQKQLYRFDSLIAGHEMPDSLLLQRIAAARSGLENEYIKTAEAAAKKLGDQNNEEIAPLTAQIETAINRVRVSTKSYDETVLGAGRTDLLLKIPDSPGAVLH